MLPSFLTDRLRQLERAKEAERLQRLDDAYEFNKRQELETAKAIERNRIAQEAIREAKRLDALHPHHKPGYELENAFNCFLETLLHDEKIRYFRWVSTEEKKMPYDFVVRMNNNAVYYFDTVGHTMTAYKRIRLNTHHKSLDDTLDDMRKDNRASRFYLVFHNGNEWMFLRVKHNMPTSNIILTKRRYKSVRTQDWVFLQ